MKLEKVFDDLLTELRDYPNAREIFLKTYNDEFFNVYAEMANSVTVGRLGYNDHGKVHSVIIAKNAIKIFKILLKHNILPNFVVEKHGSIEDALIIVILGAMLHDLGNAIHRVNHQFTGIVMAEKVCDRVIPYSKKNKEYIKLAVMEVVFSHDESIKSTSIESSIIKVADGTDCAEGRARIPYKLFGKNDIHAISALAIKRVDIVDSNNREKPIDIIVYMDNPAGIFQIQEVMQKKIDSSILKDNVNIIIKYTTNKKH
ncbi:MAG: HD domain-containing protein [Candidatus Anstonellales archaeon]